MDATRQPAPDSVELTILMPCLNEAETLAACLAKANDFLNRSGVVGEVVIADNGSTDGSQEIARAHGARVVDIPIRGYGAALQGGIRSARGKYIIMGDSDDSYDFSALEPFVEKLRQGYDLVMGNRFQGGIMPGAMPPLHRYLGNPVLTTIGRIFFHSPCGDFHCGLRGFTREAALRLDLQATGMEFASEMVVKATVAQMRIAEVPTILSPDGRSRPPHLRSWSDGWRHLRFLLLYSPRWLFLCPGLAMFVLGLLAMVWLLPRPRSIGSVTFDVHTLLYSAVLVIIGFQSVLFWIFAKIYGLRERIVPPDPWFQQAVRIITVERGLIAGAFLLVLGVALGVSATAFWSSQDFGSLRTSETMRYVIPSATMILLAFQMVYAAFFISVLDIRASIAPATPEPLPGAAEPQPRSAQ
ncbi:glycosyltransferase family 2 protein [Siccirubricoccus sp. G192]|uniref:glycosyltransferase family 2 protein n=1 Tax=Siccirubricoccus sp. G192 TaxID=2849651 RepID=UPI001C2B7BC6|nr:glycosyltransferase family 2 protein [Siccirubricoccus sp. G192]MBV1800003.1 glycosyltransferase family 2 protein [Siccirubricoccus sp. G192]